MIFFLFQNDKNKKIDSITEFTRLFVLLILVTIVYALRQPIILSLFL